MTDEMTEPQFHPGSGLDAHAFPLFDIAGTALECGHRYGELVAEKYPGYRRYLDMAMEWANLSPEVRRLVEARAPYLIDLYRGLHETARGPGAGDAKRAASGGCTSFGVSGKWTANRLPLAGQNKDTVTESLRLYIVLRIRMAGGPTILVLAYPGEVLGYGLWSTGMSVFRNSLYSRAGAAEGLSFVQWGLLALASGSVPAAAELALRHGIRESGNCLITDAAGRSASVEFNAGGVSVLPARDGIAVHANHPEGPQTAPLELYPDAEEMEHSRYRAARLRELLESHRVRLTPAGALAALADHSRRPRGLCRHVEDNREAMATTAAVIAEPAEGVLHVVPGQPCRGKAVVYRF
jgi:hypothetical protein